MRKIYAVVTIGEFSNLNQEMLVSVWICATGKTAHPQLLSVILITSKSSFTRDGIHITHIDVI
jgi:hypothetical protein